MRRFRLTDIDLEIDGRRFAVGEEVEADVDVPAELLEARRAAGTAELVVAEASAELLDLLAAHLQAVRVVSSMFDQVVVLVEAGGAAERAALLEHLQSVAGVPEIGVNARLQALLEQALNDTQPSDPAPAGETESPAEAGDQSGGEAAGDPAPPETAGAEHPPAVDGNSPPQEGAVSGEPAAGQPVAGEPAHIAEQTPAQTGAAGDGGQPAPAPAPAAQPKAGARKSGGGSSKKKA